MLQEARKAVYGHSSICRLKQAASLANAGLATNGRSIPMSPGKRNFMAVAHDNFINPVYTQPLSHYHRPRSPITSHTPSSPTSQKSLPSGLISCNLVKRQSSGELLLGVIVKGRCIQRVVQRVKGITTGGFYLAEDESQI